MNASQSNVKIIIDLPGWVPYSAHLMDSNGVFLMRLNDHKSVSLTHDCYRLRLKAYGQIEDTLFTVNHRQQVVDCKIPVPLGRQVQRKESNSIYQKLLDDQMFLHERVSMSKKAHLVLFVQSLEPGHVTENLLNGLSLSDQKGRTLIDFSDYTSSISDNGEYAVCRAEISSGYYRLVYTDDDTREQWIPIHVFAPTKKKSWDLEIKLFWREKPILDSALINSPDASIPFHKREESLKRLDGLVESLLSDSRKRSDTVVKLKCLLKESYLNPLMALMGLHMALLNAHFEKSEVVKIFDDLLMLIPDSPDLLALRYLAFKKGLLKKPLVTTFSDVPMLSFGADILYQLLLDDEIEVDEGYEYFDTFFSHRQKIGLWSIQSREPPIFKKKEDQLVVSGHKSLIQGAALFVDPNLKFGVAKPSLPVTHDYSSMYEFEERDMSQLALKNWLLKELKGKSSLDFNRSIINQWAQRANVLPATIRIVLSEISKTRHLP